MTRRARSGRGWDAAPPRAPRTRRPSPEDGPATPTTPDDDLWAADPEISEDRAPARKPARRSASGSGSDRPARTGLFRASDLRPTPDPNPPSAPDPSADSDQRPGAGPSAELDPDDGSEQRPGSARTRTRRVAFDAPIGSGEGGEPDRPRREPRVLPWSLDDMRRTGNQPTGSSPAARDELTTRRYNQARRDDQDRRGDDQANGDELTTRRYGQGRRGDQARRDTPRGRRGNTTDTPGDSRPRDPGEHAREICLRLLSVRPRTRSELAAALAKRGVPDEVVSEVLDRYDEVGIIDDAAFARAWVESRHHGKGLARRALGQELRRKGVEQDVIKDALLEIEPETEEVTARELVERKLRTTRGEPDAVFRRLVGMLARKGYPPGVAVRAVKDVLEQSGLDQDFSEQAGADWADALEAEAVQAEGERPDRV